MEVKLDLEWSEVRSPITGRPSDARVDVGNLISGGPTNSTLLTTVVSLDPIHFIIIGSEADFLKYMRLDRAGKRTSSRVAPNPVKVRLADETEFAHKGNMDFLDNVIDSRSGTIRARAIFPNPTGILTPGLFGYMRLFEGESDALLIPDTAIASDQARKIVQIAQDDGSVAPRIVTLGPMIDGLRVIRTGITATDKIVINGLQRIRPGQMVTTELGTIETNPAQN
jgi:RND family efflux transporter MFP subunit